MQFWKTGEYEKYASAIRSAEISHGIPQDLLAAVLWQSSDGFDKAVIEGEGRKPVGVIGIGRLTKNDAKIARFGQYANRDMRYDPDWSIRAAAWILRLHYNNFGSWVDAAIAYHATADCVVKHRRGIERLPIVARRYSEQILPLIGAH